MDLRVPPWVLWSVLGARRELYVYICIFVCVHNRDSVCPWIFAWSVHVFVSLRACVRAWCPCVRSCVCGRPPVCPCTPHTIYTVTLTRNSLVRSTHFLLPPCAMYSWDAMKEDGMPKATKLVWANRSSSMVICISASI